MSAATSRARRQESAPEKSSPSKPKLAIVERQEPFYPKKLDRKAIHAKLLKLKWNAPLWRIYTDGGRVSGGALQTLLLGITLKTSAAPHAKNVKPPEWTEPMLAFDFARETGFTERMMRDAIAEGIETGMIARRAETGPEFYQLKCLPEKWTDLPNAFTPRDLEEKLEETDGKSHGTTVPRVQVRAGRKFKFSVGEGDSAVTVTGKAGKVPFSMEPTIPQPGQVDLGTVEVAAQLELASPVPARGSTAARSGAERSIPAAPDATSSAGRRPSSVAPPATVAAQDARPEPLAPPVDRNANAGRQGDLRPIPPEVARLQDGLAHAGFLIDADFLTRRQTLGSDQRSIVDRLHSTDIQFFCTFVQERKEREERKGKRLSNGILLLLADECARLWPLELKRRAQKPVSNDTDTAAAIAQLVKDGLTPEEAERHVRRKQAGRARHV
jgi:hypothetical protein